MLSPRLKDHAAEYAAGFSLLTFPGAQESENALLRQLTSFIVTEEKYEDFSSHEFLAEVNKGIECKILRGNIASLFN